MFDNYPVQTSDLQTSSKLIYGRNCKLMGFYVGPAAADSTLTIQDNATSAAGVVVGKLTVKASTTGQYVWCVPSGIDCLKGIFATIAGSGAEYIVFYCAM